jgi:hypothetical protein
MKIKNVIIVLFIVCVAIIYNCDIKEYSLIEKKIYPNRVTIKNDDLIKEVWKVDYIFKGVYLKTKTRYFEDYKLATDFIEKTPPSEPSILWVVSCATCITILITIIFLHLVGEI